MQQALMIIARPTEANDGMQKKGQDDDGWSVGRTAISVQSSAMVPRISDEDERVRLMACRRRRHGPERQRF